MSLLGWITSKSCKGLSDTVQGVASELDIAVSSVDSGFGAEELPDWGGRHFRLLERPQIAILSHEGFSSLRCWG